LERACTGVDSLGEDVTVELPCHVSATLVVDDGHGLYSGTWRIGEQASAEQLRGSLASTGVAKFVPSAGTLAIKEADARLSSDASLKRVHPKGIRKAVWRRLSRCYVAGCSLRESVSRDEDGFPRVGKVVVGFVSEKWIRRIKIGGVVSSA